MTCAHPDPHAALRTRLATAPLPEPAPERVSRWQAVVAVVAADMAAGVAAEVATEVDVAAELATEVAADMAVAATATAPSAAARPARSFPRPSRSFPWSHRSFPRPGRGVRVAALAAAAGLAAVGYLGPLAAAPQPHERPGAGPLAAPQPHGQPLTLSHDQLLSNTPTGRDFGPLADADARSSCLSALGAPGSEPLAGRPVVLDGRPGVLLVLPTARPGRLRLLVVDPGCANVLADTTTGG